MVSASVSGSGGPGSNPGGATWLTCIIIISTFITRKLIQNRKCARQQSKTEQISFQFPAKSG